MRLPAVEWRNLPLIGLKLPERLQLYPCGFDGNRSNRRPGENEITPLDGCGKSTDQSAARTSHPLARLSSATGGAERAIGKGQEQKYDKAGERRQDPPQRSFTASVSQARRGQVDHDAPTVTHWRIVWVPLLLGAASVRSRLPLERLEPPTTIPLIHPETVFLIIIADVERFDLGGQFDLPDRFICQTVEIFFRTYRRRRSPSSRVDNTNQFGTLGRLRPTEVATAEKGDRIRRLTSNRPLIPVQGKVLGPSPNDNSSS